MSTKEPPQILRVKRKRTEDPLQALVMETSRRKIKRPRYIFRLKRTEEKDIDDSTAVLTASDDRQNNKPVFNIPSSTSNNNSVNGIIGQEQNHTAIPAPSTVATTTTTSTTTTTTTTTMAKDNNDTGVEGPIELNPELLEMLNDYLKDNDETTINNPVKPPKRRQSSIQRENALLNGSIPKFNKEEVFRQNNNNAIDEEDEEEGDDEYVYDVYYRDKAVSEQWETEHIGYIKFDDDELEKIDDNDDDLTMNTDDEDSNDENFYRNDYPEDEDGGYEDESDLQSMGLDEPSDDQDDEFMILNDKRRFSRSEFLQSEGLKRMSDIEDEDNEIADYNRLAAQIDEKPELWGRTGEGMEDTDFDMDGDGSYSDTSDVNFQRQTFFKTDRDDPTAIHRDRIFSKLQRMIDEQ